MPTKKSFNISYPLKSYKATLFNNLFKIQKEDPKHTGHYLR